MTLYVVQISLKNLYQNLDWTEGRSRTKRKKTPLLSVGAFYQNKISKLLDLPGRVSAAAAAFSASNLLKILFAHFFFLRALSFINRLLRLFRLCVFYFFFHSSPFKSLVNPSLNCQLLCRLIGPFQRLIYSIDVP